MMANSSMLISQPSLKGSKVPSGHIILHGKYRGTLIRKAISDAGLIIVLDETIGLIDCYPSDMCAVVIAQDDQLINEEEMNQKIKKLSKFVHHKVILVIETESNEQYITNLQLSLIHSERQIQVLTGANFREVALLISQLALIDGQTNQFETEEKVCFSVEESLVSFVSSFPGLGEKKALELLMHFKSIDGIVNASLEELAIIVGVTTAESIKNFCIER